MPPDRQPRAGPDRTAFFRNAEPAMIRLERPRKLPEPVGQHSGARRARRCCPLAELLAQSLDHTRSLFQNLGAVRLPRLRDSFEQSWKSGSAITICGREISAPG